MLKRGDKIILSSELFDQVEPLRREIEAYEGCRGYIEQTNFTILGLVSYRDIFNLTPYVLYLSRMFYYKFGVYKGWCLG